MNGKQVKAMRKKLNIVKSPRVWTYKDEARYKAFNSIKSFTVPDPLIVNSKKQVLVYRGRVVSPAYVKRKAKKELFDLRVAKKRKRAA